MRIIDPSYEIMTELDGVAISKHIEACGRTCYKSEDKVTEDSHIRFTKMIQTRKCMSVLEHFSFSVRFICDLGFSHEMIRHCLAGFSQESTRYYSYIKEKFGSEVTFIRPPDWENWCTDAKEAWTDRASSAEKSYFRLLKYKKAQYARSLLPIDVKTEIVVTCNIREWMHIFSMRSTPEAHPSMQQLMIPLRDELKRLIPGFF